MAVSKQWALWGACAGMMLVAACGDDSGPAPSAPAPDAAASAEGSGLGAGVLGSACTDASQCGTGGSCAMVQTFGMLSTLLSLIGVQNLWAPGGYCTRTCWTDTDCGTDGACLGALSSWLPGECRKTCNANTDCRDQYECAKPGQAGTAPGAQAAATLVSLPSQCQAKPIPNVLTDNQAGMVCGTSARGEILSCGQGYCSASGCSGVCTEDSTCGKGGTCVQNGFYGSAGVCAQTCVVDTDCHSYTATGSIGCVMAADGRKLCTLKQFPIDPNVIGQACTVATTSSPASGCGTRGECAATLGEAAAPNGYCTLSGCVDDSACGGGACIVLGLTSRCYARCTSDASCRVGYSCVVIPDVAGTSTASVCAPTPELPDAGGAAPSEPSDAGSAAPSEPSDAGMLQTLDASTLDAG